MASDAALRGMRALTLPFVLFATGLAGHAAAGGVTPDASLLVPMFLLTVFAVVPFAGAPISAAWSMPLLVGGQGLLHAALQLLSGTGVAAPTAGGGTSAGVSAPTSSHLMTHHPGTAASHGDAMSLMGGHLVMLLAHLAAAVAVALWLTAGERAVWMLLALTARRVWWKITAAARCFGAVVVSGPRVQTGWKPRWVVRRSVWVTGVAARRGPPGGASSELPAYAAASPI
ncbi:MAG TPA: hypothetical protein VJ820_05635 [Propionibacteriaceae bacterium]|nr:hypothetical protein [Propionibacteriaceae bacterium]